MPMTTRMCSALLIAFAIACSSDDDDTNAAKPPASNGSNHGSGSGGAGVMHANSTPDAGHSPSGAATGGHVANSGSGGAPHSMPADDIDAGDASHTTHDAATPDMDVTTCLDGITSYADNGPFDFEAKTIGKVNLWVPAVSAGCNVPVVHWANGTGATCSSYQGVLEHLASHGFLTACTESTNAKRAECTSAFASVRQAFPELAGHRLGSIGHETGGNAALLCALDAEQKWGDTITIAAHGAAIMSGAGGDDGPPWMSEYARIRSPVFMFNASPGGLILASSVQSSFDALDDGTEAYWYEASGATDIPVPATWIQESAVAWFRWKLLGDRQACRHFKDMPNGDDWNLQKAQNAQDCE